MTVGPGNYDPECSAIREATHASGVVVLVVDGDRGNGVCVQANSDALLMLPLVLLRIAAELEDDIAALSRETPEPRH